MNVDVYPFPTGSDMLALLQSRTGAIQAQLSVLEWLQFKIGQNRETVAEYFTSSH